MVRGFSPAWLTSGKSATPLSTRPTTVQKVFFIVVTSLGFFPLKGARAMPDRAALTCAP